MVRYQLLAAFMLFSSFSFADTAPPPQFGFLSELGVAMTWGDQLSPILKENNQSEVPASTLLTNGWRMVLGVNGFFTEVVGHRVANNLLQPLSGSQRTRFAVDTTEITFGHRWDMNSSLFFSAGIGVGVSKLLLQTYGSVADTADEVWNTKGQGSFVSDWNVTPAANLRLMWRFSTMPGLSYGWVMGVGASVNGLYLPLNWKQAGDVPVQGLATPWSTLVRPLFLLGFE